MCVRKDYKDKKRIVSDKVEDATDDKLKKALKMEMNQIDRVEGQALGLLSYNNANTLEKEDQISATEEEMKEELKNKDKELKKRIEELKRVRHKNVVILTRLEELEKLNDLLRKVVKAELDLREYKKKTIKQ